MKLLKLRRIETAVAIVILAILIELAIVAYTQRDTSPSGQVVAPITNQATYVDYFTLGDLVRDSEIIVVGELLSESPPERAQLTNPDGQPNGIFVSSLKRTFHVDEVLKDLDPNTSEIEVVYLTQLERTGVPAVDYEVPAVRPGKKYVLFLREVLDEQRETILTSTGVPGEGIVSGANLSFEVTPRYLAAFEDYRQALAREGRPAPEPITGMPLPLSQIRDMSRRGADPTPTLP